MHTDKTALYTAHIPVRWGDMDSFGHVNNILYLQYLEETRLQWFKHINLSFGAHDAKPVLLKIDHTYLLPVIHPAIVIVSLYASALGRSSLTLEHSLHIQGAEPICCGHGSCKLVWVDPINGRSAALPESLRNMLTDAHQELR